MIGNEEYLAQRLSAIFNDFFSKTQLCADECTYTAGLDSTTFHFICGASHLRIKEETPDPLKAAGQLWLRTPYAINPINRLV